MGLRDKIFIKEEEILYKEVLFGDIYQENILYIMAAIDRYAFSKEKKRQAKIYTDAAINSDGAFISIYAEERDSVVKEVVKIKNFEKKNINLLESVALLYGFAYTLDKNLKAVIYNDNMDSIKHFQEKVLTPLSNILKDRKISNFIRFNYVSGDINKADKTIRKVRINVFGKTPKQVRRRKKKRKTVDNPKNER